jgi:dTDP-4-amino-4,6-dideoxygalactose transaminase
MWLENNNIETRDLMPITTQPVYNGRIKELNLAESVETYEVSDRLNHNGFYIGCHQHLTITDMNYVAEHILMFVNDLFKK